jgi:hypothetical protein
VDSIEPLDFLFLLLLLLLLLLLFSFYVIESKEGSGSERKGYSWLSGKGVKDDSGQEWKVIAEVKIRKSWG